MNWHNQSPTSATAPLSKWAFRFSRRLIRFLYQVQKKCQKYAGHLECRRNWGRSEINLSDGVTDSSRTMKNEVTIQRFADSPLSPWSGSDQRSILTRLIAREDTAASASMWFEICTEKYHRNSASPIHWHVSKARGWVVKDVVTNHLPIQCSCEPSRGGGGVWVSTTV